jgi:hypothetical protein
VRVDNLPFGVSVANASGLDNGGSSYLNFNRALPLDGLVAGASSGIVRISIENPHLLPFTLAAAVLEGPVAPPPAFSKFGDLAMTVGDRLSLPLLDKNTEPGTVVVSIESDKPLPTGGLNASNELVFAPAPEEVGSYEFTVVARLGSLESRRTVKLNVAADPVKTTRISGTIDGVSGLPLAGVRVAIGNSQAVTDPSGRFEITLPEGAPISPLRVLGYQSSDQKSYTGFTSDLTSLLGHQLYQGVNNVLAGPIFLSAVAPVKAIDASRNDVEVTNSLLPAVSLKVAAGTLVNSIDQVVTAGISLTEIPLSHAPSNLPEVASPDFILSIDTSGAKFSKGAILTVANRVDYLAGTRMNLWGINSSDTFSAIQTVLKTQWYG